jgi:hypothetical protein
MLRAAGLFRIGDRSRAAVYDSGERERHQAHARTWPIREHYAASQTSASVTSVQAGDARGFPFSTT